MMKIVLDNIVYSLQKSGGISVVWYELISKLKEKKECRIFFLEYKNSEQNIMRQKNDIEDNEILNKEEKNKNLVFERYFNPKIRNMGNEKFIFISSYYRTCRNKNAINVTVVHDFTYEYFRKGLSRWMHSYQKKKAVNNSDGIICISENTKKDLLKFYPKIDKDRIKVIYNGVSNDFYKIENMNDATSVDEKFKIFSNKKIVLFIGQRTLYKNFDKAVLAFSEIQNSEYHFVIIGDKLNESETEFVKKHITKDCYTLLSGINNIKLNYLYNLAFVLIYPSSYEGFGIPLLEAMKTGLPFIAGNNSSIPEVAGDAGIVLKDVNPDSIYQAVVSLDNDIIRNSIIEKGFMQVQNFSWDQTMKNYYHFLENIYKSNDVLND
jgi:glycosyltransferase involved in cell wall biosynthesis